MKSISFKKIRKIEIQSKRLAQDLLAGAYHSAFKGRGLEFEDVREYQAGDDVKSINWHVTARMNHPYIKTFKEERELTVFLIIDLSASMLFGSESQTKRDLITEVCAALSFSALKNNDKLGLLLFTDKIEQYLPPKKGLRHILRVIRELLLFKPKSKGTNIGKALSYFGKIQRRSCICFLISDFIADIDFKKIATTAHQHDLISIAVSDPFEKNFPSIGLIQASDLESGQEKIIDTSDKLFKKSLKLKIDNRLNKIKREMQKIGAGFIDIRTNSDFIPSLSKFFRLRKIKH